METFDGQRIEIENFVLSIIKNCPRKVSFADYIKYLLHPVEKDKQYKEDLIKLCTDLRKDTHPVKNSFSRKTYYMLSINAEKIISRINEIILFLNENSNIKKIEKYLIKKVKKQKITEELSKITSDYLCSRIKHIELTNTTVNKLTADNAASSTTKQDQESWHSRNEFFTIDPCVITNNTELIMKIIFTACEIAQNLLKKKAITILQTTKDGSFPTTHEDSTNLEVSMETSTLREASGSARESLNMNRNIIRNFLDDHKMQEEKRSFIGMDPELEAALKQAKKGKNITSSGIANVGNVVDGLCLGSDGKTPTQLRLQAKLKKKQMQPT